jgi:hypothetical protein
LCTLAAPGLPDALFPNQNPNLGKFWMVLNWKLLAYFMPLWTILRPSGIFIVIWYNLWSFGIFFPFWYIVCTKKNLATLATLSFIP